MNKRSGLVRVVSAIASCVLALSLAVGLSSCGNNDEELIRASVTEVLDVFKNPTEENLKEFIDEADLDESQMMAELDEYGIDIYEFLGHCFKHYSYNINDVAVDGSAAEVAITVTNTDINAVLDETTTELTNNLDAYYEMLMGDNGEQEFMKAFFETFYTNLDASDELVTSNATLTLTKDGGEWEVDEASLNEVVSAMYGGLNI